VPLQNEQMREEISQLREIELRSVRELERLEDEIPVVLRR